MKLDKITIFSVMCTMLIISCNGQQNKEQGIISNKPNSEKKLTELFTIKDLYISTLNPKKYQFDDAKISNNFDSTLYTLQIADSISLSLVFPISNNPIEPLKSIHINDKKYKLFCDIDKANVSQMDTDIMGIYEFELNQNTYLVLINGINRCNDLNCRLRCFNIFEFSGDYITHYSFRSAFTNINSLGDFNNDGVLDAVIVDIDFSIELDSDDPNEYYNYHKLRLCSLKSGKISCSGNYKQIKYDKNASTQEFTFKIVY